MTTDSQLEADVYEALRADQRIVTSDLAVSAKNGVVTLSGQVDSLVKRGAAVQAVGQLRGVRTIANEIRVRLPLEQLRSDADIAHDAVNSLIWDVDAPDKTIRVRVQDRWIWLVGEAESQHQRLAAERAVEGIRGVKGITNLVRLKPSVRPPDLREQVAASLARNAILAHRDIAVQLRDRSVILEGVVRSWGERMAAEHCAWSRRGVANVENNLVVTPR